MLDILLAGLLHNAEKGKVKRALVLVAILTGHALLPKSKQRSRGKG
jgi:hypothetical protein